MNAANRVPKGYEPGDEVYVWNKPLEEQHSGKLESRWLGPFIVKEQVGLGSYVLEDRNGKVISSGRTYNRDHLKPAISSFGLDNILEQYHAALTATN